MKEFSRLAYFRVTQRRDDALIRNQQVGGSSPPVGSNFELNRASPGATPATRPCGGLPCTLRTPGGRWRSPHSANISCALSTVKSGVTRRISATASGRLVVQALPLVVGRQQNPRGDVVGIGRPHALQDVRRPPPSDPRRSSRRPRSPESLDGCARIETERPSDRPGRLDEPTLPGQGEAPERVSHTPSWARARSLAPQRRSPRPSCPGRGAPTPSSCNPWGCESSSAIARRASSSARSSSFGSELQPLANSLQ